MSRKSELKRLKREMLQAGLRKPVQPSDPSLEDQVRANAAATAPTETPIANGQTEITFRTTWPAGGPGSFEELDLSRLGFNCIEVTKAGQYAIRFPKPFDRIRIINGEAITLEKARAIHQAAAELGILVTT